MAALEKEKIYTKEDLDALPEGTRAELIDGALFMFAAPSRIHQEISMQLSSYINSYIKASNGKCKVYPAPFDVNLFSDDSVIVQPDISVICDPNKLTDKGVDGAPDWIIEISSPGTAPNDYIKKLWLYEKAGVKEYWIVDPVDQKISAS